MKAQLKLLSLVGLLAGSLSCLGQDTTATARPAGEAPTPERNPSEVIPLIVMDDVGLIDAIKNLARQASLNYMLDPKVPYGTVRPDGVAVPEPKISIRWEKLTAQQALTALLNNYNLVIVDDAKTSIARITVKDPAAPEPLLSQTIQLAFATPSNLVTIVQASFSNPKSRVLPDTRTSQLIVVATEAEQVTVSNLVKQLDHPPKQVLIETKIVETTTDPSTTKGIDWRGTLEAQHMTFGNGFANGVFTRNSPGSSTTVTLPGGRTVTSGPGSTESGSIITDVISGRGGLSLNTLNGLTPSIGFLSADGASAVLSFINQNSDARLLSQPRTITLDNEPAMLSVTRAEPIFKNTAGTQGSPGGSEVTYTNLGTILNVTPRISANDFIQLKVAPEVSSVGPTRQKTVASTINQADAYDIRRMETRVLIPSGNTLVLGGLMAENNTTTSTKVPVFGDIPLLGNAFKHKEKKLHKSNLLIFITPTIIKDSDFAVSDSQFMGTAYKEVVSEPSRAWSSWDSTEPYDWSKRGSKNSNNR